jgi:tetrahydrodipicolinate N-succinyltransferase
MDEGAFLNAGDFFHMGWNSQVNIAMGVEIGHEVGVGIETKIFTHGAYLPADLGFPVQWSPVKIGNMVWLPNAWVNPGVTIGDNVVVSARSLINSDLPSWCLAGGIPAKIIREDCRVPFDFEGLVARIKKIVNGAVVKEVNRGIVIISGKTYFDITSRTITGEVTGESESIKNQLRRNGIRFRFKALNGEYVPW